MNRISQFNKRKVGTAFIVMEYICTGLFIRITVSYRNAGSMTVMNVCCILSNFCPSMNLKYSNKYVHHTLQGDNYRSV